MPELDIELWLRPEDITPEKELTFVDEGRHGEIPGKEGEEPTKTFEIGVSLPDGKRRLWTMNMTAQRAVATAYGVNTREWINKKVLAFASPVNVRGQIKHAIYARVPSS